MRCPQSDVAREIDSLFRGIFWWAMAVLVVVEGALIVAIIRFRERPGAPKPRPVHGHTLLEIRAFSSFIFSCFYSNIPLIQGRFLLIADLALHRVE